MNNHTPVLLNEVVSSLKPANGKKIVDATLGTAGHAIELVKKGAFVIGIDDDTKMLKIAKKNLKLACPVSDDNPKLYKILHGNFSNIRKLLNSEGISKVDGILADLGISSIHLDSDERGFSFKHKNDPLDMRLNSQKSGVSASDLLNALNETQLVELFGTAMEPSESRYLAKRVVAKRAEKPFQTVSDFTSITQKLRVKGKIDQSTLPFMALRIAVNTEYQNLIDFINQSIELLKPGGQLAIITFHSGEDRIVKRIFANYEHEKPIHPTDAEIKRNPRSRSAKLRVLHKNETKKNKKPNKKLHN